MIMRGLRHVGLLPTGIGRVLTKIGKKGGIFFRRSKRIIKQSKQTPQKETEKIRIQ